MDQVVGQSLAAFKRLVRPREERNGKAATRVSGIALPA